MAIKYWVGGGASTNWDATGNTNWSDSSGGANNATVPATGDDIVFDGVGGSANGTATLNVSVSMASFNFTGFTGTFSHTFAGTMTVSGNTFTLSSGMTYSKSSSSRTVTFTSTSGTCAITSAGKTYMAVIFNGTGGTFQLQDNLSATEATGVGVTLTAGTLALNGFTLTHNGFVGTGSTARAITFGSGGISLVGTGSFDISGSNVSVTKGTGNITVSGNTASNRNLNLGTAIAGGLPAIILGSNTSTGVLTIAGTSTMESLAITAPHRLRWTAGTTFTIANAPTISGSSSNRFHWCSSTPGSAATISVASGTVSVANTFFEDITGTGGATFTATDSYNVANNTGITITEPAGGVTGVIGS